MQPLVTSGLAGQSRWAYLLLVDRDLAPMPIDRR